MSPITGASAEAIVRLRVQVPLHGSVSVTAPVRSDAEMRTVAAPSVAVRVEVNDWEAAAPEALKSMVSYFPVPLFQYETMPARLTDGTVAVSPAHASSTSL